MKLSRESMLKLRWQVKYRTRVIQAALKCGWDRAKRNTARAAKVSWRGICGAWQAAGYYISLALLLVILGCAAYAYRMRPEKMADPTQRAAVVPENSHAAAWSDFSGVATPAPEEETFALIPPVPGDILRPYETDSLIWSETMQQWQTHPGVDFAAELGEVVCAAEAGEIIGAYKDALLGNVIEIRHPNGWITQYAALNTLALAEVGQHVKKGETISAAGNSGNAEADLGVHVHFAVIVEGKSAAPEFPEGEALE